MINTYSNSPPPVPPRSTRQEPPSQPKVTETSSQIRVLAAVVLLHFVVTSALFVYFFWSSSRSGDNMEQAAVMERRLACEEGSLDQQSMLDCLKREGKVEPRTGDPVYSPSGAVAHMKVERPSMKHEGKNLQWNEKGSFLKGVRHNFSSGMLQIRLSGYYYVYSKVTFSKTRPKIPLVQTVMRWEATRQEGNLLLKAFCYQSSEELCTSFQGGVFKLEQGQQLSVNVTDMSLVNFDGTATTFGLFQLLQIP